MKAIIFAILLLTVACSSAGQESGEQTPQKQKLSFFIGAAAGNFGTTIGEFKEIYSKRSISRIAVAGIGSKSAYLFGKFRQFYAHGRSTVENADAQGSAEWKQKFYSIGARLMSDDSPLYVEIAYVISDAEENISTHDPDVEELKSQWKAHTQGVGAALGIVIDFPRPLKTFIEFEHTSMLRLGRNPYGRAVPQIGGNLLSAGFIFIL
ncbi:MAG: hypothetical protein HYV29_09385 [Ignavibacteriales bacterium]|nr:hypothetical protein [Ignavibacteriales bacterium]